jgi:hypothetical protein
LVKPPHNGEPPQAGAFRSSPIKPSTKPGGGVAISVYQSLGGSEDGERARYGAG